MADQLENRTISKNNAGFPDYLDFDKLRSAAIDRLGKLTGRIWTDYNVHDPGITILETLIYAVLDLGYRTNLPLEDLLARKPDDRSRDDNFFTARQILSNNPLTITDYRKMLCDIESVRNAWLEVEEDPSSCEGLNGLYHVYVQLEDGVAGDKGLTAKTVMKIRKSLMAHRNLCEDFIDITVLCPLEIGVCVLIDLDTEADVEDVLFLVVETLSNYFSPAPVFYSLQQMLDRKRPIEEIFAGRPLDIRQSHGFIDTVELEELKLKKELHLSDVYHLLLGLSGIAGIQNLEWITCCDGETSRADWKLGLPENYAPVFSVKCSGFSFTKNGMPIKADLSALLSMVELKMLGRRKGVYKEPSSFLDPEVPVGIYHNDLADHYSIQNEFPRVYGIGKGALASDATDKRKAQALQLQGFLLFFDQLLANYLMQMKNIRSLFSLSSSGAIADRHTYFSGELTNAPALDKLLRFRNISGADNVLGTIGSLLAYPTDRAKLQALIDENKLMNVDLDGSCKNGDHPQIPPYSFCFGVQRDQTLLQVQNDFLYGNYSPVIVSNYNDCYFFYFFTSSPEVAIISKRYYKNRVEAGNAAASLQFAATVLKNYRKFTVDCCGKGQDSFSFDIELNLDMYTDYLQLLVEDRDLFIKRRQQFLDHLLARFAERFTDFALISAPFTKAEELPEKQIYAEEAFLGHYDELSGNRGKAYDYFKDKWENLNVSGFEKRWKALMGIADWRRHYLCNFVVEPMTKLYGMSIYFFDQAFTVRNKTLPAAEAMVSLRSIYKKLINPCAEYEYDEFIAQWEVFIRDESGNKYVYARSFKDKEAAMAFSQKLDRIFTFRPRIPQDIVVTRHIFKALFADGAGKLLAEGPQPFANKEEADNFIRQGADDTGMLLRVLGGTDSGFEPLRSGKLLTVSRDPFPIWFIDEHAFVFRESDVFLLKDTRKRFSLLNLPETFQFDSLEQFDDTEQARQGFRDLLILLTDRKHYSIAKSPVAESYELFIVDDGGKKAKFLETFPEEGNGKDRIEELLPAVKSCMYQLYSTDAIADEWEFTYRSEDLEDTAILYTSKGNYRKEEEAIAAADAFYTHLMDVKPAPAGNELNLLLEIAGAPIRCTAPLNDPDEIAKADQMLRFSQDLYRKVNAPTEKDFENLLEKNNINPGEEFIYKLVDKDFLPASYPGFRDLKTRTLADARLDILLSRGLSGYNYVDIAIGGNVIHVRKDPKTKVKWHHYRILCNNRQYQKGSLKGKELVLFESTRGYVSKEEALAAFMDNHLLVLQYARDTTQYGPNKPISLEELLFHTDEGCDLHKSIVFVPRKTSDEYGGYDLEKELALLAASYPIRRVNKKTYRFVLGQIDEAAKTFQMDWRGNVVYKTAKEAMYHFQFFLILLKYPGNYFVEWNRPEDRFQIHVRETLAISAHGFATETEAWGKEGVEKFICVAQSKEGVHHYQDRIRCHHSFFIACGNTGLVHPCVYETPERRDDVIQRLYQAGSFDFFSLVSSGNDNSLILHDNDAGKTPLANLYLNPKTKCAIDLCDALVLWAVSATDDKNYIRSGNSYQLNCWGEEGGRNKVCAMVRPADPTMELKEWKARLQEIACLFPIITKTDACEDQGEQKYFIAIRLPGFNSCGNDLFTGAPGGEPCQGHDCVISCWMAWESDCCFDSCCDAMRYYKECLLFLADRDNYRPVYDCDCNTYRIELHMQLSLSGRKAFDEKVRGLLANPPKWGCPDQGNSSRNLSCETEIVAINPQYYPNERMGCEAASRAKRLTNSEGVHLVEHILLRPRDPRKDRDNCKNYPKREPDAIHCHFPWKPGGEEDPCEKENPVCFTPGCDPYSFIATVVLPAWPERFRLKANREMLEKSLQREAPAHVLLRILWLRPGDLFSFENYFRLWGEWLARKISTSMYSDCDFLGVLFKSDYPVLEDCEECSPCNCAPEPPPCLQEKTDDCEDVSVPGNINELFDWGKDKLLKPLPKIPRVPGKRGLSVIKEAPLSVEGQQPVSGKERIRQIRMRSSSYENNIREIVKLKPLSSAASDALTFLKKTKPAPAEFIDMTKELLDNGAGEGEEGKALSLEERRSLARNIAWRYLDLVCFEIKDMDKIKEISPALLLFKKNGIDMAGLFDDWKSGVVKQLEPTLDIKWIRKNIVHPK